MWAPIYAPQTEPLPERHHPCLAPASDNAVMHEQFETLMSEICDCDACHLARFKLREILMSKFRS